MAKTKKVHSTGRFGSRYGVGIRKRVLKVEVQQKQKQKCSYCNLGIMKRKASGIFECSKCGKQIAGGAYVPETMTGSLIKKIVSQKKFSSGFQKLDSKKQESDEIEIKKEEKKHSKKEELLTKAKSVLGIQTFSKKFDQKQKAEQKTEEKKEGKK